MTFMRAFFAAMLFVIGCGAIEQTPPHCQADLASSAPADMSGVSPDLTKLPTGAGPGARCHVEADCDGIATAERYCATNVYEPDGSEGYCLEAIQTAAGAYHIYFGDPGLTGRDAGEAYCDMTGLPVNLLPPSTFVCGTFSIR